MAYDILAADPGGEPWINSSPAGLLISMVGGGVVNNAPAGRATQFAWTNSTSNTGFTWSQQLLGNYQKWIIGFAFYDANGFTAGNNFVYFKDGAGIQCGVSLNALGQFYFFRGSSVTAVGSVSTNSLNSLSGWHYFEISATLAGGTSGSMEIRVDGVVWLTVTGQNFIVTANSYAQIVLISTPNNAGSFNQWLKDIVVMVDTGGGGMYPGYLGDITVGCYYGNAAGVNQTWAPNVGPFTLTSVNTTGLYQGTITGGASGAYIGKTFTITGFISGSNNITAACTGSSVSSLQLSAATATESAAGTASFKSQAEMVNDGILGTGTRPDEDVTYIASNTPGQISDFAHTALALTGQIFGVIHLTRVRKDDAGSRSLRQVCLSGGTAEDNGTDLSIGNTYQWYWDILQKDPHTAAQWLVAGFNAATFGVKEIS